jgi:hypothetical protein
MLMKFTLEHATKKETDFNQNPARLNTLRIYDWSYNTIHYHKMGSIDVRDKYISEKQPMIDVPIHSVSNVDHITQL